MNLSLRHIISKTSINSSSLKNRDRNMDEKSKLIHEIELLKDSVKYLSNSLENQDEAVKTLSNEKEKLYLELKSVQRINRNLKQQLDDERDIHFKEKEYLIGELMKFTNPSSFDKDSRYNNVRSYPEKKLQDNNNDMIQQQLNIKDEVIYNISRKYMKINYAKKCVQKRICFLQHQTQEMCKNIIFLLQENQETLDKLIDKLLVLSKLSSPAKQHLHDLKSYGHLHYENMQLKIAILSYKTNVVPDETRCKKCTSITDYAIFSKSDAKMKNQFNWDKWKSFKGNNSNLTGLFVCKSDSCLVFHR